MHATRQQLIDSIASHKEITQLFEDQLTRTELPPRTRTKIETAVQDGREFIWEMEALLRKSELEEAVLAGLQ